MLRKNRAPRQILVVFYSFFTFFIGEQVSFYDILSEFTGRPWSGLRVLMVGKTVRILFYKVTDGFLIFKMRNLMLLCIRQVEPYMKHSGINFVIVLQMIYICN